MPEFSAQNDAPPVPPEKPGDEECCRSGCDPCIFDLYAQELERYRAALAAWEQRQQRAKDAQGSAA